MYFSKLEDCGNNLLKFNSAKPFLESDQPKKGQDLNKLKKKSRCHRFHILGGAMKILVDFHPGNGVTVPKFQMQII